MATIKQIEANRLNAKKSTGPKTPAGKARSSRNAFIHGLSSQRPTVTIENSAEFNAFANKFMDQYEPLEPSEIFLVRRIACMAWRIQRAQCYETLVLDNLCNSFPEDDTRTDQDVFSQLLLDDFREHQTLAKLQRYETQLERCILRCMKELRDSRKASEANYTDVANYLRDGQSREDYKDLITPYGEGEANPDNQQSTINSNPQSSIENRKLLIEPNSKVAQASVLGDSVAEASSFGINSGGIGQAKLGRGEFATSQADSTSNPVNPVKKNEPTPATIDGLTNPDLPWIPAENKVYKTENQRIRNNPNKEKWNFDYAPNWYIRVLDAVHFSPKKRKTMTDTDLEKHASCIVRTFQNPEQFLLDIHAITLKQKPIEPNLNIVAQASVLGDSVAEASSFGINSGGIGQAKLGRGEFATSQANSASNPVDPVNPVKKTKPNPQSSNENRKSLNKPNSKVAQASALGDSVAEAFSFGINSGGIGQAKLGRGEFATSQADSASNPVDPVNPVKKIKPNPQLSIENRKSLNEPNSEETHANEYELCEV